MIVNDDRSQGGVALPDPRPVADQGHFVAEFIRIRQAKMLARASRLIRRYDDGRVGLDAEDLVQETLLALWRGVGTGKVGPFETLVHFVKVFRCMLRRRILDELDGAAAIKRGGEGEYRAGQADRDGVVGGGGQVPPRGFRRREQALDGLRSPAPTPEDLALAKLDYQALLERLDDPVLRTILELRHTGWTNVAIAEHLDRSPSFVEHKCEVIRSVWRELNPEADGHQPC